MGINVDSIERGGIQFVPLRTIVEQLGGNINWNNESKSATFSVRNVTGQVSAGSRTVNANGRDHGLTGEPFVENGTLYVPVDLLNDIGLSTNV